MKSDARSKTRSESLVFAGDDRTLHPKHVYRVLSFAGLALFTTLGIVTTNGMDGLLTSSLPAGTVPPPSVRWPVLGVAVGITILAVLPLCKPRPRRILDTVTETLRYLLLATTAVATVGYFSDALRVPRVTLVLSVGSLAVVLPAWFVLLQQVQLKRTDGTLVVGNNPKRIEAAVQAAAEPIVGYAFSPTDANRTESGGRVDTDGGRPRVPEKLAQYQCLGGLSRLDDILAESSVGTVIPALPQTDRAEFFGVLETCHRHDVNVEILNEHNESVLVKDEDAISTERTQRLIGINMEPLDLQNRLTKRCFDVCFAGMGLVLMLLVFVPIAVAIKLDSPGPVFYRQERTTQFGDRFAVYKFRSMVPESESASPGADDDRVTRVGQFLRRTHLDELPQLWAIFTGTMSVVGPRAAWTAEEEFLQREMSTWKKRWFVKPGLTGLAQINDVSSENSRAKLQYDLTYIRNQSFRFDVKIVIRQVWMAVRETASLVRQWLRSRATLGRT